MFVSERIFRNSELVNCLSVTKVRYQDPQNSSLYIRRTRIRCGVLAWPDSWKEKDSGGGVDEIGSQLYRQDRERKEGPAADRQTRLGRDSLLPSGEYISL